MRLDEALWQVLQIIKKHHDDAYTCPTTRHLDLSDQIIMETVTQALEATSDNRFLELLALDPVCIEPVHEKFILEMLNRKTSLRSLLFQSKDYESADLSENFFKKLMLAIGSNRHLTHIDFVAVKNFSQHAWYLERALNKEHDPTRSTMQRSNYSVHRVGLLDREAHPTISSALSRILRLAEQYRRAFQKLLGSNTKDKANLIAQGLRLLNQGVSVHTTFDIHSPVVVQGATALHVAIAMCEPNLVLKFIETHHANVMMQDGQKRNAHDTVFATARARKLNQFFKKFEAPKTLPSKLASSAEKAIVNMNPTANAIQQLETQASKTRQLLVATDDKSLPIIDFSQLEFLLKRPLNIDEVVFGPAPTKQVKLIVNAAKQFQQEWGASNWLLICSNSLDQLIKQYGFEHPETAFTLGLLALVYQAAGGYQAAFIIADLADAILKKFYAKEHTKRNFVINIVQSITDLCEKHPTTFASSPGYQQYRQQGITHQHNHEFQLAIIKYQTACLFFKRARSKEKLELLSELYFNLATCYLAIDKLQNALGFATQSYQLRIKTYNIDNPSTNAARILMMTCVKKISQRYETFKQNSILLISTQTPPSEHGKNVPTVPAPTKPPLGRGLSTTTAYRGLHIPKAAWERTFPPGQPKRKHTSSSITDLRSTI